MPQDLKVLAEQRKILAAQLAQKYPNGVVPITSVIHYDWIEHKPGVTMETTPYLAAKMLFKQTHREATPEEHQKCLEDRAARVADLDRQEAERRMREGKFAVLTDPRVHSGPSESELAMAKQLVALQAQMAAMQSHQQAAASDNTLSAPSATPVGRTSTKRDGSQ